MLMPMIMMEMSSAYNIMVSQNLENELEDILCGGQDFEQPSPIKQNPDSTPSSLSTDVVKPLTVLGLGGVPVIVEDPVRFRNDIQTMVMSQMMNGLVTDKEFKELSKKGSVIEIATVTQLIKAAAGDLDSFKYLMDRVLGKPVSQTNSVSMTLNYEQLISDLDPEEIIKPKKVFCEEI